MNRIAQFFDLPKVHGPLLTLCDLPGNLVPDDRLISAIFAKTYPQGSSPIPEWFAKAQAGVLLAQARSLKLQGMSNEEIRAEIGDIPDNPDYSADVINRLNAFLDEIVANI